MSKCCKIESLDSLSSKNSNDFSINSSRLCVLSLSYTYNAPCSYLPLFSSKADRVTTEIIIVPYTKQANHLLGCLNQR